MAFMAHKPFILCVDDEILILESLRRQLFNALGDRFDIEVALDGPEAIENLQELLADGRSIPLVVTDYIMPGMKGEELVERIHAISPESRVIVLSGQANNEAIQRAITDGKMQLYLSKPWIEATLLNNIRKILPEYFAEPA